MNYMKCNTCHNIVQVNATGICLGCQMGFAGPQSDSMEYKPPQADRNDGIIPVKEEMKRLREREKEIEDALKIGSTEKVVARKQTKDGSGVGKSNSKRKKTTQKSKEEKAHK